MSDLIGLLPEYLPPHYLLIIVLCLSLGIFEAGFLFFHNDPKFKNKYLPWFFGTAGVLISLLLILGDFPITFKIVGVAISVLILFFNNRASKFCEACGKLNYSHPPVHPPNFCQKCGASLGNK